MRTLWLLITALAAGPGTALAATPAAPALASVVAEGRNAANEASHDGVVEAVRQTVIAAQVPGAIVALQVKPGDSVKAGQVLARIDSHAADQNALASDATVRAARASLDVASKDFERQKQLYDKNYISQAALERAEAQFKATQAQVAAQLAQAGAAHVEAGFHTVRAPYAGVVSEVPVSLGDMALPGRPLLTLYDPSALRVTAAVPQASAAPGATALARLELPALPATQQWVKPLRVTALPAADSATHTVQVRFDLPATPGLVPGMFARAWIPSQGANDARVYVPGKAIVRRAELTALYVINPEGRALLRQVRLGRAAGDRVEVLSGLSAGERVALDPQAAGRQP
ncbi:MAG: efflux RND transporter periplasmic adaptor subunit [Rhizobacter sp.]|nr:efflux RND transporter periplasmic adaptor subunit [Rhizobacter sp.]